MMMYDNGERPVFDIKQWERHLYAVVEEATGTTVDYLTGYKAAAYVEGRGPIQLIDTARQPSIEALGHSTIGALRKSSTIKEITEGFTLQHAPTCPYCAIAGGPS